MKLKFDASLEFQRAAISAVVRVFEGQSSSGYDVSAMQNIRGGRAISE